MSDNYNAIAIDGPSGAGKSTIARRLAGELGFTYVDTGALYRAVGVAAIARGVDPADDGGVTALLPALTVSLRHMDGEQHVFVCGTDVTGDIRTPEASMAASAVSAHSAVRAFLFDTQQHIAATTNVVMDGRDIGTVVLPNAQVKIFLTATPEDRARRRYLELVEKGAAVTYEEVLTDIKKRDHNDSTRALAPLKPAPDAITADTTGCTLEEAVARLRAIVLSGLEEVPHGC